MKRLFLALLMMTLGSYAVFAIGDEYPQPSSPDAYDGSDVYAPINPAVKIVDEQKIQQEDQNMTHLGGAK